jgi:hypothetical protein
MARARNIKPSFFVNEQLADQDPLGRILFVGLWTLADYKGDLEWKERTIKVQLLPFDNCDVKHLAINLDKSGLIKFYSDGNKTYITIPNFEKHQNPHPNERKKGSDVPAFTEKQRQAIDLNTLVINHDKSRQKTDQSISDPALSSSLKPESPILNPAAVVPTNPWPGLKSLDGIDFSQWPSLPTKQTMTQWVKVRKNKSATNSQIAMDAALSEILQAYEVGISADQCIAHAVGKSWAGFKWAWVLKELQDSGRIGVMGDLSITPPNLLNDLADRSWAGEQP